MGAQLTTLALSIAAAVAATLIIAAARALLAASRNIATSAAATKELAETVAELAKHDAENRERIAVMWSRLFPAPPPKSPWSPF